MIILHFDLQPQFKYMSYFIYISHHPLICIMPGSTFTFWPYLFPGITYQLTLQAVFTVLHIPPISLEKKIFSKEWIITYSYALYVSFPLEPLMSLIPSFLSFSSNVSFPTSATKNKFTDNNQHAIVLSADSGGGWSPKITIPEDRDRERAIQGPLNER